MIQFLKGFDGMFYLAIFSFGVFCTHYFGGWEILQDQMNSSIDYFERVCDKSINCEIRR